MALMPLQCFQTDILFSFLLYAAFLGNSGSEQNWSTIERHIDYHCKCGDDHLSYTLRHLKNERRHSLWITTVEQWAYTKSITNKSGLHGLPNNNEGNTLLKKYKLTSKSLWPHQEHGSLASSPCNDWIFGTRAEWALAHWGKRPFSSSLYQQRVLTLPLNLLVPELCISFKSLAETRYLRKSSFWKVF